MAHQYKAGTPIIIADKADKYPFLPNFLLTIAGCMVGLAIGAGGISAGEIWAIVGLVVVSMALLSTGPRVDPSPRNRGCAWPQRDPK